MLSQVFWAKVMCFVVLVFLFACQSSPTGNVVGVQEAVQHVQEQPREVIINSLPDAPEKPVTNTQPAVIVASPAPEVIIFPEDIIPENPVGECTEQCKKSCTIYANRACSQTTNTACKSNCGEIINPSACATACSLRNARLCEPKFIEFCAAQCEKKCYS